MVYYYDAGGTTPSSTGTVTTSECNVAYTISATTCSGTASSNDGYYAAPRQREIVVEHPADWTEEQHRAYIRLVNEEAMSCGWRVTMLFRGGDLALVDPNIEIRKMRDFVPLLLQRASIIDRQKIDAFFKKNKA